MFLFVIVVCSVSKNSTTARRLLILSIYDFIASFKLVRNADRNFPFAFVGVDSVVVVGVDSVVEVVSSVSKPSKPPLCRSKPSKQAH